MCDAADPAVYLNKYVPPELNAIILEYSSVYSTSIPGVHKILQCNIVRTLREWCTRIGMIVLWCDIPTAAYEYIRDVWHHCYGGWPDYEYAYNLYFDRSHTHHPLFMCRKLRIVHHRHSNPLQYLQHRGYRIYPGDIICTTSDNYMISLDEHEGLRYTSTSFIPNTVNINDVLTLPTVDYLSSHYTNGIIHTGELKLVRRIGVLRRYTDCNGCVVYIISDNPNKQYNTNRTEFLKSLNMWYSSCFTVGQGDAALADINAVSAAHNVRVLYEIKQ